MDDKKYECDLIPLIVYVPNNTVALDLNATVIEKDKSTQNVMNTMSIAELYEARLGGEEWESENGIGLLMRRESSWIIVEPLNKKIGAQSPSSTK